MNVAGSSKNFIANRKLDVYQNTSSYMFQKLYFQYQYLYRIHYTTTTSYQPWIFGAINLALEQKKFQCRTLI